MRRLAVCWRLRAHRLGKRSGGFGTCRIETLAIQPGRAMDQRAPRRVGAKTRPPRRYLEELKTHRDGRGWRRRMSLHRPRRRARHRSGGSLRSRRVNSSHAPRELMFKAWSGAEHMKRWFSPEGCSVPEATVDFRPGGVCRICIRLPTGRTLVEGPRYRDRAAATPRLPERGHRRRRTKVTAHTTVTFDVEGVGRDDRAPGL